jgi:hypothetical protein
LEACFQVSLLISAKSKAQVAFPSFYLKIKSKSKNLGLKLEDNFL